MLIAFLTGMIKFPCLVSLLAAFMFFGFLGKLIIFNKNLKIRFFTHNTQFWCKLCVFLSGFKFEVEGKDILSALKQGQIKNPFILSNHLSYWDILILSSLCPLLFITSREMKKTPFLGQLAELGGSFFVERRTPAYLHQEIQKIAEVLKKGFPVVLFPEGTTSNGQGVMPFKKSLLACAVESNSIVLPVTLRYDKINGKKINDQESRNLICWYGDMNFFIHLIKMIFKCRRIQVKVAFSKPILPEESLHPSISRKILSEKAYQAILSSYLEK